MKKLSRDEMKKVMGGNAGLCTPGTTITGYSGGGVPGGCKLDLIVCNLNCQCLEYCQMPYADSFCEAQP